MSEWKTILTRLASNADEKFDELKYRLADRLESGDPVMILPYRGYGTRRTIHMFGRVLEDSGIRGSTDNDTVWQNLLTTYRRINSDEVPNVRIGIRYGATEEIGTTDGEGYFRFELTLPEDLPADTLHHEVELWLPDEVRGRSDITATGQLVVPPAEADFGVISDIDDTIIQTSATNLLTAARLTFLENARTRQPFEGVAAFYRALLAGPAGTATNPLFFVSSGPWNLYDLLVEFMEHNDIPSGPIFLQDYGVEPDMLIHREHLAHKTTAIARLMETYPNLPFVLIGDSGQHDPEVYRAIVEKYPGRVKAIYIRDVSVDERDAEVSKIADELKPGGVTMILTPDSRAAAEHAAGIGLIKPEAKPVIETATEIDKAQPEETEQIVKEVTGGEG